MRIICIIKVIQTAFIRFRYAILIWLVIQSQFLGCSSLKPLENKTLLLAIYSPYDALRLQGFRDGLQMASGVNDTAIILFEQRVGIKEKAEEIAKNYQQKYQKVVAIDLRKPVGLSDEDCLEAKSLITPKPRPLHCDSLKFEKMMTLFKLLFPAYSKLGAVWVKDSISNSEKNRFQAIAARNGIELMLEEIENDNEFESGFEKLLRRKPQVFFAGNSPTLHDDFEAYAEVLSREKIPIVTTTLSLLTRGAFAGFGLLPYQEGRLIAEILNRASIPSGKALSSPPQNQFYFQPCLLAEYGVKVPASFMAVETIQRKK